MCALILTKYANPSRRIKPFSHLVSLDVVSGSVALVAASSSSVPFDGIIIFVVAVVCALVVVAVVLAFVAVLVVGLEVEGGLDFVTVEDFFGAVVAFRVVGSVAFVAGSASVVLLVSEGASEC
jgi:hypothetical protein